MNNYSIDAKSCQIEIILTKGNHWPQWTFENNFQIVDEVESDFQKTVNVLISDLDSSTIILERTGKDDNETIVENNQIVRDQTLGINRVWINGVLIEWSVLQKIGKFYPEYSETNIKYAKENNIVLEAVRSDLTFFYNGKWVFKFEQPFFTWYNQILFNEFKNFNQWVRRTHLGIASEGKKLQLDKLLIDLS